MSQNYEGVVPSGPDWPQMPTEVPCADCGQHGVPADSVCCLSHQRRLCPECRAASHGPMNAFGGPNG